MSTTVFYSPLRPGITFVMATYNRAWLLPRALMSLLNQSLPAAQVIVVDDASADDTWEILGRFASEHERLKIIRREENSSGRHGLLLNQLIAQVETEWYMPHSDDDSKRYSCLETLLNHSEGYDVVYGDSVCHNYRGGQRSQDWDPSLLRERNYIDIGEAVVRKSVWQGLGGYDEHLIGAVDWEFWLRLARSPYQYKVLHVPYHVTDYFFHNQMLTKHPEHQKALADIKTRYGL